MLFSAIQVYIVCYYWTSRARHFEWAYIHTAQQINKQTQIELECMHIDLTSDEHMPGIGGGGACN